MSFLDNYHLYLIFQMLCENVRIISEFDFFIATV